MQLEDHLPTAKIAKCYSSVMATIGSDTQKIWYASNQYHAIDCPMGEALYYACERKKADLYLLSWTVS